MIDVHHGLVVALTAVDRERAHAVLAHAGDGHRVAGVVAMLLAFVSQFTGGGFLLGLLLGIIGGILAIFFEADTDTAVDLGDL